MFRFACLLMTIDPALAAAQCQLCAPATPSALPNLVPLRIDITTTLDLGRAAQTQISGSGAIALDAGGQRRVTGSLADLGGFALTGTVQLSGQPFAPVLISLPQRVTLYAPDGSSAEVTDIRASGATSTALDALGALTLTFGGMLNVSNGVAGDFRGQIPITAEYR